MDRVDDSAGKSALLRKELELLAVVDRDRAVTESKPHTAVSIRERGVSGQVAQELVEGLEAFILPPHDAGPVITQPHAAAGVARHGPDAIEAHALRKRERDEAIANQARHAALRAHPQRPRSIQVQ